MKQISKFASFSALSAKHEVKFKVPAHLELIKKVPLLEWKMAPVIEHARIATSFPNAKEN